MSNITEIQRLLNEKADLQAQINISAFDGSIEVKTVNDQKYIYVRKREAGKYKSNYIDKYSEELYALAVNQSQQIRAVKKQLRKIEKDLAKLGYTESELSPRVKLNIDFARANVKNERIVSLIGEVAEKWDIKQRRIRVLCSEGRIPGAYKVIHLLSISMDTIM